MATAQERKIPDVNIQVMCKSSLMMWRIAKESEIVLEICTKMHAYSRFLKQTYKHGV